MHDVVTDSRDGLRAGLDKAKKRHAVTILSAPAPLAEIQADLPLDKVDVLIVKSAYEPYGKPRMQGRTIVLKPGSRGMRLGQLDLDLDNQGNVTGWRHKIIPLSVDVQDAPRMQVWYEDYNRKVEQAYKASVKLRKQQPREQGPFVGHKLCKNCHADIYDKWQHSDHARAFADLERVGKAFDPACVRCHTLGFGQAGGFIDMESTPDLANVQCESCHGSGREHLATGGQKALPHNSRSKQGICNQCHTHTHSPVFDLSRYWPKIAH